MTSDEIRESFLRFFEERQHRRLPSASLVPPANDRTVLLTTAGMQPLKPYFQGREQPPAPRLTSCQKCFRTVDIDNVGNTLRHLTFFEMLGNFSVGDYFKTGAIEFAWQASLEVFGFDPKDIWVTVFEGDEQLGLGPDEQAIAAWLQIGVARERIVLCARSENFWQAGPTGPSGPCSELYIDRGLQFGSPEDLPGGENERFLEYWNLVFMQYDQDPPDRLTALPTSNIDTGLGLNRMAAILQNKASVFETDQFAPLIELGEELSGRKFGQDRDVDRALCILADHTRGMTFLVADGVVPSNEERGYVLRRIMRRAIQQGRGLGMEPGFLPRFAARVEELMGRAYPELGEQRDSIHKWLASEEESFGRTLEQGLHTLRQHIAEARDAGSDSVRAEDAFKLHDTFGFPFDLTKELLAEEGLAVDEPGFERLMDAQRARARAASAGTGVDGADSREHAREFAQGVAQPTRFTGYETEEQRTTVGAVRATGEQRYLVKLAESPFYAAGGGQVSDTGTVECEHGDCRARVESVFRLGDDQVLSVVAEAGTLDPGAPVIARVEHAARHATECNHTATHLLQAALRQRLGAHVHQAGSYVGPDKLRFDFNHSQALSTQELRDVEDQVNAWILRNDPIRPVSTTLDEAKKLGAMALFGEKYGDIVRMVEVGDGDYSRELCGGTHVRSTAEIGLFRVTTETSSAANVRRMEAVTGPAAVALLREHDRLLRDIAHTLKVRPQESPAVVREREAERKQLEQALKRGGGAGGGTGVDVEELAARAEQVDGALVLSAAVEVADAKVLVEVVDRIKGRLESSGGEPHAIVLGTAVDGRVHLIASVAPALVERGLKAGAVVKAAAAVVGGGGGGRDTLAQAGGRDPQKLEQALAAGRSEIESALTG
ncbi:MAG TPA: alanine--tRNA ligase [Solirubrobacteraceae bacterium]|nr:alanine--tRNA ligase [Solirubrobacteraceae bacterium]